MREGCSELASLPVTKEFRNNNSILLLTQELGPRDCHLPVCVCMIFAAITVITPRLVKLFLLDYIACERH